MVTPETLADLRKKAVAACDATQGPLECTDIGMERVADLEFIAAARAAGGGWVNGAMYGAPLVLALLDRIAELERFKALANAATDERIRDDNTREAIGCTCLEKHEATT